MRNALGVLAGLLAGAAILVLRDHGQLQGLAAVFLAMLLVLALPTSRLFSRRVLLTGLLLAGWIPMLWWVRLPVGSVGRVSLLLSIAGAGIAYLAVTRPKSIIPDWRIVDALPVLAVIAALLPLRTWLTTSSPAAALSFLDAGWDNAAHYDITELIRAHGVTIDALGPAPDGSQWGFAHYPQSFHTTIAAIIELLRGARPLGQVAELVPYVRAQAILFALIAGLVVAGMVSVPAMRRRPLFAAAASSLVVGILVFGVGAALLTNANLNYLLAIAAVIGACELAIVAARPLQPVVLGGLAAAGVSVANGWSFLVVPMIPVVIAVLFPVRRRRFRVGRNEIPWVVIIGIALTIAAVHSIGVVIAVGGGSFLNIPGYTPLEPPSRVLVIALIGLVAGLAPGLRGRMQHALQVPDARLVLLTLVPLSTGLLALVVGLMELPAGHGLTYYFWKLFSGLEMLALPLGLLALARLPVTRRLPRRYAIPVGGLVALLGWQAFGLYVPVGWLSGARYSTISPMLINLLNSDYVNAHPRVAAQNLISAVPIAGAHPNQPVGYLAVFPPDDENAGNALEWYWSLTGRWTALADRINFPPFNHTSVAEAGLILDHALAGHPDALVIVAPDALAPVRAAMTRTEFRTQVISW